MREIINILKSLIEAAENGNDELVDWYIENQYRVQKIIDNNE